MKCDYCGANLVGNETNCPYCGMALNKDTMQNTNTMNGQNEGISNSGVQSNLNEQSQQPANLIQLQPADNTPVQPTQAPVQPMMQPQPNMYNNQYQTNNYNYNNNNMYSGASAPSGTGNKKKKLVIGLMLVIIILLCVVVFMPSNNDGLKSNNLKDGSRTIMIYMVGSNLETDAKIATYDLDSIDPNKIDLDKYKVLLYTGGTEKWHNFVKNDENGLYELTSDGFVERESYKKKNMGSSDTLKEFLDYGYDNYDTQYYDLILYNHGGAIDGAIYDDFTKDNLSLSDFSKALDDSKFSEKNKLNTVLFRTCLNGTIEVASIFAPYAEYLIASEEVTNGGESSVLNFINDLDTSDDGVEYGKKFIDAYDKQIQELDPFGRGTMPMYAIIDLDKVDEIQEVFDEFINSIDLEKNYSEIVKIRSKLYQYGYTSYDVADYDTVDLYTLVNNLDKYSSKDSKDVTDAIEDAVVYNWSCQKDSHGLSVYFPYNAHKVIQTKMLGVYKKMNANSSYYKFIGKFNNLSTSKKSSSFALNGGISDNKVVVNNDKEFSLQLTAEQQQDYATSIYMIFRKDDDGLYNPIYSSDNTELTEDGILKTHISNNLIKICDKSDPGEEGYLMLIERTTGGIKSLSSNAVLTDMSSDEISQWKTAGATVYFDVKDNVPSIASVVNISIHNGVAGTLLDINEYEYASFVASGYPLIDENNNFTDNWDNGGKITAYEVKIENMYFKLASLGDDEEYFCVFKVRDIYGNEYYSKVLNIK